MSEIKYIDVLADKVYIEFNNNDSSYVSFNKAKNIIKKNKNKIIKYGCADNQKALDFVNANLLRKEYKNAE